MLSPLEIQQDSFVFRLIGHFDIPVVHYLEGQGSIQSRADDKWEKNKSIVYFLKSGEDPSEGSCQIEERCDCRQLTSVSILVVRPNLEWLSHNMEWAVRWRAYCITQWQKH